MRLFYEVGFMRTIYFTQMEYKGDGSVILKNHLGILVNPQKSKYYLS